MEQGRRQRCVSTSHNRSPNGRIAGVVPTTTLPPPCIGIERAKHPARDDQHGDLLLGQRHGDIHSGLVQEPTSDHASPCRSSSRPCPPAGLPRQEPSRREPPSQQDHQSRRGRYSRDESRAVHVRQATAEPSAHWAHHGRGLEGASNSTKGPQNASRPGEPPSIFFDRGNQHWEEAPPLPLPGKPE